MIVTRESGEFYTTQRTLILLGITAKELSKFNLTPYYIRGHAYYSKVDVDKLVRNKLRDDDQRWHNMTADEMIEEQKRQSLIRWHKLCERDRMDEWTSDERAKVRASHAVMVMR